MASEEVLDFTRLLAPIPGENPAGDDLREDFSPDSVYRQIRAARSEAREAERRVVYHDEQDVDPGEPADWKPVLELAPGAIAERSKDLEIVAYLTEALVRRDGYPGLRDGFRLARELVEQYWDNIFPLPDEEGVATRVSPLSNLNGIEGEGLLIGPITKIPITDGTSLGPYSALDYRLASEADAESDPDKRARRLGQPGFVTKKMFDGAVSETTADWFRNLLEDIDQCSADFEKLCEVLEEKCGQDESGYPQAPPSSSIRSTLQDCRDTVVSISRHLLEIEEEPAEDEGGALAAAGGGEISQVRTREEAFRAFLRAADFFRRTEPHSPISYKLEEIVRWGRMELPDLLKELIEDGTSLEGAYKKIGFKPPPEPEETY